MAAHQTKRPLPDSGLFGTLRWLGRFWVGSEAALYRSHRLIAPISNGAHRNKSVLPATP